jgi:hypothetical protein
MAFCRNPQNGNPNSCIYVTESGSTPVAPGSESLVFRPLEFTVTHRGFLPFAVLLVVMMAGAFAQNLPDVSSVKDLPSTTLPKTRYQRRSPISIHTRPDLRNSTASSALAAGTQSSGFSLTNVISIPTFQGSFISRDITWHLTMAGTAPWDGLSTSIPAHIVAVSLRLQNANLVTYTTVSVGTLATQTLKSPNFQAANYSTGSAIQFADAVQRAEWFHKMKAGWHTNLRPAAIVHTLTITVPRFTTVDGMQVQTYYTSKANDGRTVVFLLDQFLDLKLFDVVVNEINAGRFTTGALNVALFPNTFLFSLNNSGGVGSCCILGFHTYFSNGATPKESRWLFAFASWVSPGIFSGFQDVTALSHEISEALNDPFVDNLVPAWQFPNEPGTCQDNLETGDPVEVLQNPMFPVNVSGFNYHPQTEALMQWFEQKSTSTAINSAFSYPNTKALTQGATPFGPLTCP